MIRLISSLIALTLADPVAAAPLRDSLGFVGFLANCDQSEMIKLMLSSGEPLGEDVVLQSDAYNEMDITADGSAELAMDGASFFRSVWMDEVVVNDIQVRPIATDSDEIDEAGTVENSFVAINPGQHDLRVCGSTRDAQRVVFTIQ